MYRITFQPAGKTAFTWGATTFLMAKILHSILFHFREYGEIAQEDICDAFTHYLKYHNMEEAEPMGIVNCNIDKFDGQDWWTVASSNCWSETKMGITPAFDTSENAMLRYIVEDEYLPPVTCYQALKAIIELGKRDLSNPKFDSYFDDAIMALNNETVQPTEIDCWDGDCFQQD